MRLARNVKDTELTLRFGNPGPATSGGPGEMERYVRGVRWRPGALVRAAGMCTTVDRSVVSSVVDLGDEPLPGVHVEHIGALLQSVPGGQPLGVACRPGSATGPGRNSSRTLRETSAGYRRYRRPGRPVGAFGRHSPASRHGRSVFSRSVLAAASVAGAKQVTGEGPSGHRLLAHSLRVLPG